MYLINVIIFNEIHLRRKKERLGWRLLYIYYLPYKIILTGINVASCYWSVHGKMTFDVCCLRYSRSLWKYARYFAKRHPKVIEDEKALEVVIRLEEGNAGANQGLGRSLTIRAIGPNLRHAEDDEAVSPMENIGDGTHFEVTEPEQVHIRTDARTLEREGVATTDHVFQS
jgi:hypothetical protein